MMGYIKSCFVCVRFKSVVLVETLAMSNKVKCGTMKIINGHQPHKKRGQNSTVSKTTAIKKHSFSNLFKL